MRIAFIGAVDFSAHCLREILACGGNVVAIFTLVSERIKFHADAANLGQLAHPYNIPLYRVRDINHPRNVARIRTLKPDVIFVFGWSHLISQAILKIPPRGCIGTHPALLPKNRGRHPIVWALVQGLSETGLTFFYLDKGADSGDILWQKSCKIDLTDDAASLYKKIKQLASEGIREFLPQLECNTAQRIPQDHARATYWRKRTEKDGEINWASTTLQTYNLIRALTRPYVGAHTYLYGDTIKIWRTHLPTNPLPPDAISCEPGVVFHIAQTGELFVRTGDDYLIVREYETLGNNPIVTGDKLETRP